MNKNHNSSPPNKKKSVHSASNYNINKQMKKITLLLSLCFLTSMGTFAQFYHLESVGSMAPFTRQVSGTYNTLLAVSATAQTANEVMSSSQTIPWTYDFYGTSYSTYKVSDNGYITFDAAETTSNPNNIALPNAAAPKAAIFGFWDDLKSQYTTALTTNSLVISYTVGTAPNRQHIIKWFQSMPAGLPTNDKYLIFAVALKEQGGFNIIHESTFGPGSFTETGTIGCQNADGTDGTMAGTMNVAFPTGIVFSTQDDDIVYEFIQGVQPAKDITITSLDLPVQAVITAGAVPLKAVVRNLGSETITSLDLTYTINGGPSVTDNIATSIAPGARVTLTQSTIWTPSSAGTYTVAISTSNPNGAADENTANNNPLAQDITVLAKAVQRVPLYEIFTSSTCGPCTPGNANFHSVIDGSRYAQCTYIKYQQNFPGAGDPYASSEAVGRRNYYAINSIPRMEIDGGWDGNASSFLADLHDDALDVFSVVELAATFDKWGQSVTTTINIDALSDINSVSVYAAAFEYYNDKNVKTNGETEFIQVFKRFMSPASGELVNLTSGTTTSKTYQVDFKGEYQLSADGQTSNWVNINTNHDVEEFTNLGVIVWVQDNATKEVLQSTYAEEVKLGINDVTAAINAGVSPNPTSGIANIAINLTQNTDVNVSLTNAMGQEVNAYIFNNVNAGENTLNLNISDYAEGVYFFNIVTNEGSTTKKVILSK
jgi:hypothetical protein